MAQVEVYSDCASFRYGDLVEVTKDNQALIDRLIERGKVGPEGEQEKGVEPKVLKLKTGAPTQSRKKR